MGNGEDVIDLKFVKKPQNWNIKLSRTKDIKLKAYETTYVELTATAPKYTIAGEYNISIEATLQGDDSAKFVNTTIIIDRIYGFKLECENTQFNIEAGISAKYEFELFNNGNAPDWINLTIQNLPNN